MSETTAAANLPRLTIRQPLGGRRGLRPAEILDGAAVPAAWARVPCVIDSDDESFGVRIYVGGQRVEGKGQTPTLPQGLEPGRYTVEAWRWGRPETLRALRFYLPGGALPYYITDKPIGDSIIQATQAGFRGVRIWARFDNGAVNARAIERAQSALNAGFRVWLCVTPPEITDRPPNWTPPAPGPLLRSLQPLRNLATIGGPNEIDHPAGKYWPAGRYVEAMQWWGRVIALARQEGWSDRNFTGPSSCMIDADSNRRFATRWRQLEPEVPSDHHCYPRTVRQFDDWAAGAAAAGPFVCSEAGLEDAIPTETAGPLASHMFARLSALTERWAFFIWDNTWGPGWKWAAVDSTTKPAKILPMFARLKAALTTPESR